MKKALIVLLILAVAGGLFAQELTWNGAVGSGFVIDIIDGADDIGIKADDDDAGAPVKARIGLAYGTRDWGLKLGTGADVGSGTGTSWWVHNAYGWMNLVGGMLNIKAGLIDDGVWNTGNEVDENVSTGTGVRLEVMPIPGLNFGAKLGYPTGTGYAAGKIANFFGETAFGVSYASDLFKASASMKLYSEESDPGTDGDSALGASKGKRTAIGETDFEANFCFGFNVVGISIVLDGAIWGLGDYSNLGEFDVYEEFSFGVSNALKVGLLLGQALSGPDGFVWFKAKPWVEFGVTDAVTVGGDVGITMAKADSLGLATIFGDLWAKYTIGGGWMKAGYGFTNTTEDYSSTGESTLNHYIRATFGYSF